MYFLQYHEGSGEDGGSGYGDYEDDEYSDQNSDPDPDCHNKDKVQMTALYYCPAELEILKCCPKGENINVVNASCTNQLGFDDFIKRVEPTVISEFRKIRMDDYRLIIFRKSLVLPCNSLYL